MSDKGNEDEKNESEDITLDLNVLGSMSFEVELTNEQYELIMDVLRPPSLEGVPCKYCGAIFQNDFMAEWVGEVGGWVHEDCVKFIRN